MDRVAGAKSLRKVVICVRTSQRQEGARHQSPRGCRESVDFVLSIKGG